MDGQADIEIIQNNTVDQTTQQIKSCSPRRSCPYVSYPVPRHGVMHIFEQLSLFCPNLYLPFLTTTPSSSGAMLVFLRHPITFIRKALAMMAVALPMSPSPITPMQLPRSSSTSKASHLAAFWEARMRGRSLANQLQHVSAYSAAQQQVECIPTGGYS